MGSCVSRSTASASTAGSSGRRVATAKVVGLDGSMAQYAGPVTAVTAREALGEDGTRSVFLCSSDEPRFDAPPRALADEEALQSGWLYFVLPVSMLRLVLSAHEMAVLAVRASSALAVANGVASLPRRKKVAGANSRQRKTARVAPLSVAPEEDAELADGGRSQHTYGKYGGDETAGKARKRAGYKTRVTRRRRAATPKLSAILESDDF